MQLAVMRNVVKNKITLVSEFREGDLVKKDKQGRKHCVVATTIVS